MAEMNTCLKIFGVQYNDIIEKLKSHSFFHKIHYNVKENFPEFHIFFEGVNDEDLHKIKTLFSSSIFAEGDFSFSEAIKNAVMKYRFLLTTVESCTGGLIGHLITETPKSSEYYLGGFITYSDETKIKILGVSLETIKNFGAVSSQTAIEMAMGGKKLTGAHISVAVTGIAGPGGGSEKKPVGTVFIAMLAPEYKKVEHYVFKGDRKEIKILSSYHALNMVRVYCQQRGNF